MPDFMSSSFICLAVFTAFFSSPCMSLPRTSVILTNSLEPTNESFAVGILSGMQLCKSYNLQYGTNFISNGNDNYVITTDWCNSTNNYEWILIFLLYRFFLRY